MPGAGVLAAWSALGDALEELAAAGRRTPCQADPAAFTSDDPRDRYEAAMACRPCPILIECGRFALANRERHGVWASVDLTAPRGGALQLARLARVLEGSDLDPEPERPPR